jgi:hypothetical protein
MDLCGDGHLRAHRINGDAAAPQLQGSQQAWDGFYLVALLCAGHLPGAQAARIDPGTQQMHTMTAGLGIMSAPKGLAINSHMQAFQGATPVAEDLNHGLRFEHHEDVSKDIVGGGTMLKGHEAAQPRQLRFGKVLHVGETFRITEHGTKTAEQHFIKAVLHFTRLACVGEFGEGFAQTMQDTQVAVSIGTGR